MKQENKIYLKIRSMGRKDMIKNPVEEKKTIKCTLTRIEDEFNSSGIYEQKYVNVLKNYIYIPEKKVIA